MHKDLFGNEVRFNLEDPNAKYITERDENLFALRLARLNYLHKIDPNGLLLSGDAEFVFTYREIQLCYIDGHFLATIVLSQAFVEKIIFGVYEKLGFNDISKKGLSAILKHAKVNQSLNEFIIRKVDSIRVMRNPITHLAHNNYEHTLSKRSFKNRRSPLIQIEIDAKEALEVAVFIALTDFGSIVMR